MSDEAGWRQLAEMQADEKRRVYSLLDPNPFWKEENNVSRSKRPRNDVETDEANQQSQTPNTLGKTGKSCQRKRRRDRV